MSLNTNVTSRVASEIGKTLTGWLTQDGGEIVPVPVEEVLDGRALVDDVAELLGVLEGRAPGQPAQPGVGQPGQTAPAHVVPVAAHVQAHDLGQLHVRRELGAEVAVVVRVVVGWKKGGRNRESITFVGLFCGRRNVI